MTPDDPYATDFAEFFVALWGKRPFCWQKDLAKRVLECEAASADLPGVDAPSGASGAMSSSWPDAIALPTASGKTACMDIALFALAAQAARLDSGQAITTPRRIFFVVDRRVIVDEAYERARRLAEKLEQAVDGILKVVADDLRRIAHGAATGFGGERPLAVYALRGGMYRSEAWARNPLQPAIVASTVDQNRLPAVVSRLRPRCRNLADLRGLVANDSLILLDEAHCAQPFLQTLRAVRRYRTWAHEPLRRCFHPVVMSATPPPGIDDVFSDLSGDGRDPDHPLGRRQLGQQAGGATADFQCEGRQGIRPILESAGAKRSGSSERRSAGRRRVRQSSGDRPRNAPAATSEGRGRSDPADRPHAPRGQGRGGTAASRPGPPIETRPPGADWKIRSSSSPPRPSKSGRSRLRRLGHRECASLDALRQRFGRMNRMGREIEARAWILIRADQAKRARSAKKDPVYGEALTRTWKWLGDHENEDGEVDFGIAHLDRLLAEGDSLAGLDAPSADAPVMLPAHVDCWAQTAPEPRPSPDVAHFLRGPRESVPDVQVCWRADIDLTGAGRPRTMPSNL